MRPRARNWQARCASSSSSRSRRTRPRGASSSWPRCRARPPARCSATSCAAARSRRSDRGAAMRIAVVGGGPGGLYLASLAKQLDPRHEVDVWERNAADDTFGFGVVFSDETLTGIEGADLSIFASMEQEFARWDDIDVHYRDQVLTSGGHAFAAMGRKRLLEILQ